MLCFARLMAPGLRAVPGPEALGVMCADELTWFHCSSESSDHIVNSCHLVVGMDVHLDFSNAHIMNTFKTCWLTDHSPQFLNLTSLFKRFLKVRRQRLHFPNRPIIMMYV